MKPSGFRFGLSGHPADFVQVSATEMVQPFAKRFALPTFEHLRRKSLRDKAERLRIEKYVLLVRWHRWKNSVLTDMGKPGLSAKLCS
ncbi:MAG: hypothetical protein G3I11_02550 [Ferrovum sp.]|nr:hypothetical protein [Ferrovum sp.]